MASGQCRTDVRAPRARRAAERDENRHGVAPWPDEDECERLSPHAYAAAVAQPLLGLRSDEDPNRQEAAMRPIAVEKELLELERQYWQAMQDRDVKAAVE